jgi:hypothetical protein
MTDATTEASTLEDGGALELVRTPAWEAQYRLGQDPKELAHMFCCRDMDWGKAMCGYEDPDPDIMYEAAGSICTMCVEASGGPDGPMATRRQGTPASGNLKGYCRAPRSQCAAVHPGREGRN